MLLAQVWINEILASNDRGLLDYRDDDSDWIELYNAEDSAVDIGGWYLTDDASELDKWQFPPGTTIPAMGYQVVFASGDDVIQPNGEIHTNFQLAQDGDYVALVENDGATIHHEFPDPYPPQTTNVSYGLTTVVDSVALVDQPLARYWFPSGDSEVDWNTLSYNDASWPSGALPIGYAVQGPATLHQGFTVRMIDVEGGTDGALNTATEALSVLDGTSNPAAHQLGFDYTTIVSAINMGGGGGTFGSTEPYPDGTTGTSLSDFAVRATANVYIPEGDWTIGFGSDDGGLLRLEDVAFTGQFGTRGDSETNDNEIRFENTRGHGWTRGTFTVGPGGLATTLDALFFERGGGDSFEIAIYPGTTSAGVSANTWTLLADGALGWSVETPTVPPLPPFASGIQTDVQQALYDQIPPRTTMYTRIPFQGDGIPFDRLTLQMRYDDAFVAYLNGVEVARANAPESVRFDSVAIADRDDHAALAFEDFDLSSHVHLLVSGTNILAIQSINASGAATGFLVDAKLVADRIQETTLAFTAPPTPGTANEDGRHGVTMSPEFSTRGGTFSAPFSLSIISESGATMHYTTDGSVPTTASPTYTAPFMIEESTQVRALAVHENRLPSEIVTESYHKLNADIVTFDSDLPVLVIDTAATAIGTNSFTSSSFSVFEPSAVDSRTTLTSTPTIDMRAGMRIRGSSSAGPRNLKKNFAVELWQDGQDLDERTTLLGMPSEADWTLHAPDWFDRTLINNAYIYELSNQVGRYAVRTRFVEVFLNTDDREISASDYHGVYVLTEKIEIGDNRVDIEPVPSQATTGIDVTGGYVFKIDRADPGDSGFTVTTDGGQTQTLRYVEPKEIDIELRPEQQQYVHDYFDELLNALEAMDFMNPDTGIHYTEYLDRDAFVDHHILNELMLNVDALRLSAYLFKGQDGKLEAGPLWDFDRAAESNDGRDNNPATWYMDIETVPWWWHRLFDDIEFRQAWIDRWQHLRKAELSDENLTIVVDSMTAELLEASVRNEERWGGNYPPRTSGGYASGLLDGSFSGELAHKKAWLLDRVGRFDDYFLPQPAFSIPGGIVTPGTLVQLTSEPGNEIFYTLDGSDPRLPGGGISNSAVRYTEPVAINELTVFTARTFNAVWNATISDFGDEPESWSGPIVQPYLVESPSIQITEINYHPTDPTTTELAVVPELEGDDFEFIELANVGDQPVDLLGTQFVDGIEFTFSSPQLVLPGEHILLVKNQVAFEVRYGLSLPVVGEYAGGLRNSGEQLRLVDAVGQVIDNFEYEDGGAWPDRADGHGSSLEVINVDHNYELGRNWRASSEPGGSPGWVGEGYRGDIVINEVLSHTDPPQTDTVELYNASSQPIDLSGWYLSDSSSSLFKFEIPDGTVLASDEYLLLDEGDFNLLGEPNGFALNGADGDELVLTELGDDGAIRRFVDAVTFDAQANAESWARFPNATGVLHPAKQTTLGRSNDSPRIGPVRITEIMYHPPDPGTGTDADLFEYIELYNSQPLPIDLTEWRVRGGVDFEFADGLQLGGREFLVLVGFNPADPLQSDLLNEFRSVYGIDDSVRLVGPYSGRLDNAGDAVRLQRPDESPPDDPTTIPRLLEDTAYYDDGVPWSILADGQGESLHRRSARLIGDYSSSWFGSSPTPGAGFGTFELGAYELNFGFVDPPDLAIGPQPSSWNSQRSDIYNLRLEFDGEVDILGEEVRLVNLGINAVVDPDVEVVVRDDQLIAEGTALMIHFDLEQISDGVYQLSLPDDLRDGVGNLIDGNGDGNPGDGLVIGGDAEQEFYRLKADFNGNRAVAIRDFFSFSYWYAMPVGVAPQFVDMNHDDVISVRDYLLFAANYTMVVTYPASPAPVAVAPASAARGHVACTDGETEPLAETLCWRQDPMVSTAPKKRTPLASDLRSFASDDPLGDKPDLLLSPDDRLVSL